MAKRSSYCYKKLILTEQVLNSIQKRLVVYYGNLSTLTKSKCFKCNVPLSCCDNSYCLMAERFAKETYGVTLESSNFENPRGLKFMGEKGCVVPPHLRPICTAHVCEHQLYRKEKFSRKYFRCRGKIQRLENILYRF